MDTYVDPEQPTRKENNLKNEQQLKIKNKKMRLIYGLIVLLLLSGIILLFFHIFVDNNGDKIMEKVHNSKQINLSMTLKDNNNGANQNSININGNNVLLNIFPRKTNSDSYDYDGQISYIENQNEITYSLFNNQGYFTMKDVDSKKILREGCLRAEQIPPFSELENNFRNARVIDSLIDETDGIKTDSAASLAEKTCKEKNGKLIELQFAGDPYVFCSLSDNLLNNIIGENVDVDVEFIDDSSLHQATDPNDLIDSIKSKIKNCPKLPSMNIKSSDDSIKSKKERMLSRINNHYTRWSEALSLKKRKLFLNNGGKCSSCKGQMRDCIFLHGLGSREAKDWQDTPKFFGNIQNYSPCCKSIKFLRLDTVNNNWESEILSNAVCDALKKITGSTSNIIMNGMLITHSMGNLIFANALHKNKCSLDSSSRWVSLQAPMKGSKLTDKVREICNQQRPGPLKAIASIVGECPPTKALKYMPDMDGDNSNDYFDEKYRNLHVQYRNNVDAALCGTRAYGLNSIYSTILGAAHDIAQYRGESDGAVAYHSCADPLNKEFKSETSSRFYKAKINHKDGAFVNGDGWWGSDRKPIQWFSCLNLD